MIALIGNLDTTELIVVVIAAVLIFGRRLPQVAAQAGTQIGKLRRQLDSAWKDSGVDKEVREVQRSIESIRDAVPRDLSAGGLARTAASEFQRRVEVNQKREELAQAAAASPEVSSEPDSTPVSQTAVVPAQGGDVAHAEPLQLPRRSPDAHEALGMGADAAPPAASALPTPTNRD